jgi:7-cyano-7-deazaguanine synthase
MCGILGVLSTEPVAIQRELKLNAQRGRDSWGYASVSHDGRTRNLFKRYTHGYVDEGFMVSGAAIVNMRAEPTTEYINDKRQSDVQPYVVGDWMIVHNGTIANDKELVAEHGWTPPTKVDSWVIAALCDAHGFNGMLERIIGSYAIIAINLRDEQPTLHYAVNYRPLYVSLFHEDFSNKMTLSSIQTHPSDALLKPYSTGYFRLDGSRIAHESRSLYKPKTEQARALVVLSGGLDSTVAAAALQRDGYDVELLHFDYGARATTPERSAVLAIAERLGCKLHFIKTDVFTEVIKGSRLTNTKDEAVAQGEAGAEYAHEWVPARNLIMMSIAIGIAESRGFDVLALGANLEEAGAYPDNEPEFVKKLNQLIPFAVADGKQLRIETPVGNLMKHEIVKLGLEIGAPMELSWSCYDANQVEEVRNKEYSTGFVDTYVEKVYRHCGKCGPCFMRRTAFAINGAVDPVFAAEEAS